MDKEKELKLAKLELEYESVKTGKRAMEVKIMEREIDIDRLKTDIEAQDKRILEIKKLINAFNTNK